ncbi:hypothetical protein [Halobaculum rarum]|uniref:hypothetical protein n=1 Tax=Halobaculum rarum TaxID=3075122 RepID=UPI0032AFD856
MSGVQLGWIVAEDEWDEFKREVEERCYTEDRVGPELERAWREWREIHSMEEYVKQLLRAVGLPLAHPEKTKGTRKQLSEKSTTQAWVTVHPRVKQEMKQYAKGNDVQEHEVLRSVIAQYIDGGLVGYVTEKLERAVPEVEAAVAELDESPANSDEADAGLSKVEKKRRWLARYLMDESETPKPFTSDDFGQALEAMPYRGSDSEHMRETHREPVLDRLGFIEHPNNSNLFVPVDKAREYADELEIPGPDAPAFERKGFDDLDTDQRTRAIRVAAIREAHRRGGKGRLTVGDVCGDGVFREGSPSDSGARSMMERAASTKGFTYRTTRDTMLLCNLDNVADDLLAEADVSPTDGATSTEAKS